MRASIGQEEEWPIRAWATSPPPPQTAFFWFVKIKLAKVARQISETEAMEALKTRRPIENSTSQRRNGALRELEEVG
jgi:hypothetical protein